MVWWMTCGYLVEALGMALTAAGLFRTWKENADKRPFFPAKVRRAARRLLRRPPRPVTGSFHAVLPAATARFHGYSSEPVDPAAPIEEQIAALAANTERAQRAASHAAAQTAAEADRRAEEISRLRHELEHSHGVLATRNEELAVGGIPIAVTGLFLVALGFFIQAGATLSALLTA